MVQSNIQQCSKPVLGLPHPTTISPFPIALYYQEKLSVDDTRNGGEKKKELMIRRKNKFPRVSKGKAEIETKQGHRESKIAKGKR